MNEYPLFFDTTNPVHLCLLLMLLKDVYKVPGMEWKINEGIDHTACHLDKQNVTICKSVYVCMLLVKDRSVLQGLHGFSQHRADITGLLGQSSAFVFVLRRKFRQEMHLKTLNFD